MKLELQGISTNDHLKEHQVMLNNLLVLIDDYTDTIRQNEPNKKMDWNSIPVQTLLNYASINHNKLSHNHEYTT